jgi:lipopolysaccharide transport system ATP-binding protein
LLEVGTGFHPELTGRENIYLNGTILGMSKREIDRKFDEIVDFAGIEKFLDTPTKRYSTGMYVRLAFAVAAHLEPEILIIDEVLAVGDTEFQRKCLGKIQDVAQGGRTVLFVSHNMVAVEKFCTRTLLLDSGSSIFDGSPSRGIGYYLEALDNYCDEQDLSALPRKEGLCTVIRRLEIIDHEHRITSSIPAGTPVTFVIYYEHTDVLRDAVFHLRFETPLGIIVFCLDTKQHYGALDQMPTSGTLSCCVPHLPLVPGVYFITVYCLSRRVPLDWLTHAVSFTVMERDVFGTGFLLNKQQNGLIFTDATWRFCDEGNGEHKIISSA